VVVRSRQDEDHGIFKGDNRSPKSKEKTLKMETGNFSTAVSGIFRNFRVFAHVRPNQRQIYRFAVSA